MSATWRPIPGWGGRYRINKFGAVESVQRTERRSNGVRYRVARKMLQPFPSHHGVGALRVQLCKPGQRQKVRVDRLIAVTFGKV